jgi:hypothetical protein
MAPTVSSPPPSFALSVMDDDQMDTKEQEEESKYAYLVVALCPCLVFFIRLVIVLSIILVLKFHFFCHTPLHSLFYKKKLLISHLACFS